MSHDPESVAITPGATDKLRKEQVKHLLIGAALATVLGACGLSAERDVRAYDTCMSRHPQEAPLCEGPLKAYELDTSTFQARAAAYSVPAGSTYEERSPASILR
jgi:hypothetical protein